MSIPARLGKYDIRRELGKGAMGVVYEGHDPMIDRVVAIKTILPAQLRGGERDAMLARFRREAQAAGRLNHPGIVAVYDYGELGGSDGGALAYIAMEFIAGRELRDALESGERATLADATRLLLDVLDALAHAHAQGVVHRDLKPANLMLLPDGRIKIADFGIARIESSQLTQAGTVMGTPAYMSPEQFMGLPVDGRSDLFSCGVILYQLITGEKPFQGSNTTTIMYKVLNEEPPPPSALNLSASAAFDAVVARALAKKPELRFQTAAEFAAALRAALDTSDAEATRPGGLPLPPTPMPVSMPPPAQAVPAATRAPVGAAHSGDWAPTEPATLPGSLPEPPARAPAAAGRGSAPQPMPSARRGAPVAMVVVAVAVLVLLGSASWVLLAPGGDTTTRAGAAAPPPATAGSSAPAPAVAAGAGQPADADPPLEPGMLIISASGSANPNDPRFAGDSAAAQAEARAAARRALVEKALALQLTPQALEQNRALLARHVIDSPQPFIRTVLREQAQADGPWVQAQLRAVVNVREVQKKLNQLSREERVDLIRRQGDPRIAVRMVLSSESAGPLPPQRSQLAENILKERIKSFGFRVWSADGEAQGASAQKADFVVQGEARMKTLSARLEASGLTITKTVLTAWTIKAIDQATGEEIYLDTVLPKQQSWAGEEQALSDIGRQVGDAFSRNFFLSHLHYGTQPVRLEIAGVGDAALSALLLRALRASPLVLDAQPGDAPGRYQLRMGEGPAGDLVDEALVAPLNARAGQNCLSLQSASGGAVMLSLAPACGAPEARARLEAPPTASKTST